MKKIYSIFIVVILLGVFSCTKQQGPIEPIIVVTTVSYANDIQPIFDTNCILCHKEVLESSFGDLNLEADKSYEELINIDAEYDSSVKRVVPEDAVQSILWQKINNSETYGDNMPLGSSALSQNDQNLIKVWIEEGALNN